MIDKEKFIQHIAGVNGELNERKMGSGWLKASSLVNAIKAGTFDAHLTEEVRQLREQLEEEKIHNFHLSGLCKLSTDAAQNLHETNTKLVKALEWISRNEGSSSVADVALEALSEIKGHGDETNE